jgi:drug/metabolite transporter (DMT)-like permease
VNVLLAMLGVVGVSLSGPIMAATAAPAMAIAFWRTALATAALGPFALTRSRGELRALDARGWRTTAFAGLMLALHFATWITALTLTSVAAATALVATQLVWVVLVERLRGTPVARPVALGSAVAIAGVLVVSGVDFSVSPEALLGDLCALLGGMFAALYLVAGESVRRSLSTTAYTFVCYGICAVALAVACAAGLVPLVGFDAEDWLLMAAVTVVAQLGGHSIFNHLLAVMSPTVVSLFILLEVPGAALLAALLLGQTPAWGVYVGLALMLAGLAVVTLARRPEPAEVPLAE